MSTSKENQMREGPRRTDDRVVLVTTCLGDSVLSVRQLGQVLSKRSWLGRTLQVTGAGLVAAGLSLALAGQPGLAAVLLLLGLSQAVLGSCRLPGREASPHYTLGRSRQADLPLTVPSIPLPLFPLVRASGGEHLLLFTREMNGRVTLGADQSDLQALVRSGQAVPAPHLDGVWALPIWTDAHIQLEVGPATLVVQSVVPAEPVRSSWLSGVDWNTQVFHGLSFAAHALVLLLVLSIPPGGAALDLDRFGLDRRLVRHLVRPQVQDSGVPTWLNRPVDQTGPPADTRRADTRPSRARIRPERTRQARTTPAGQADLRTLARSRAQRAGVLELLRGSGSASKHLSAIFGHGSALDSGAEEALNSLMGDGTGEDFSIGGLGPVGTGRGGGSCGDSCGGVAVGVLNTRGRWGSNEAGYGSSVRLPSRQPRKLAIRVDRPAEVRGSLSRDIVRRIVRRHLNEVRYCYIRELQTDQNLGGRLMVRFTIAGTGRVTVSSVIQSTLQNAQVESCVARAVQRWEFPRPADGGLVMVSYPFIFRPAGASE